MLSHREHFYICRRRDELPNIAEYKCRLLSRRKHRPQRTKSFPLGDESSHRQDERRKEVWRRHEIVKGKGVIYHSQKNE